MERVNKKTRRKPKRVNSLSRNIFSDARFITEASLDKLAQDMVDLVDENKNILTFSNVILSFGLTKSSFYNLLARNKNLKKAREYILFKIGMNREELALKKKIDGNIMRHQQGLYDPDWKKQDIFFADIRKPKEEENKTQIIVVKDFDDKKKIDFKDISDHIEKI